MTPPAAATPAAARLARAQRKRNLLLASQLARGQAVLAVDEISGRADAVALKAARVRGWFLSPMVQAVGAALGAMWLVRAVRQGRAISRGPRARGVGQRHGLNRLGWVLPAWRAGRVVLTLLSRLSRPGSPDPPR